MRAPVRDGGTRCPDAPSGRASYAHRAMSRLIPCCPWHRHGCAPRRVHRTRPGLRSSRPARAPSMAPRRARTRISRRWFPPRTRSAARTASTPAGTAATRTSGRSPTRGSTRSASPGGTWEFGSDIAAVLAVFAADKLTVDAMADWWESTARASSRTQILGSTSAEVAGRTVHRLDTKTGERIQSVLVWAGDEPGQVNVVLTPQPARPEDRSGRRGIRRLTAAAMALQRR